jgi:23S rRNA (uracil1939-C5)-methyltransferase
MAEIIVSLDIVALTHGGRGLGRYQGKAVFVPLTLPGDRVACRVIKAKKSYIEAELHEIVTPSPLRRKPPCPFFGTCGGCQWQHIPYPEQASWKEKIFGDLMVRNQVVASDRLKPIVTAPDEWHYRNRVQLKCNLSAESLDLGFYRQGSHRVVDIDRCLLVASPIQKTLALLRDKLSCLPCSDCVVQIDLACGDDGEVRAVFHLRRQGHKRLRSWLESFARHHHLNVLISCVPEGPDELLYGERDLTVKVDEPEISLRYAPGGFVQVNSLQNRRMLAGLLELLALKGTETIMDLFCGMGNFSLPMARRAERVTGVEDSDLSIASARLNAAANNVSNLEFYAADAAHFVARQQAERPPDIALLDPPRTGSYRTVKELARLGPERILYVSCDPATLARDLVPLVASGYEVISSQPYDLFPQTWHIESLTLLARPGVNRR